MCVGGGGGGPYLLTVNIKRLSKDCEFAQNMPQGAVPFILTDDECLKVCLNR